MKEFYIDFKNQLSAHYSNSECSILWETFREYFCRNQHTIEKNEGEFYQSCIQELLQGKPYQHCIGEAYFYGKTFVVNEHTLIPRPETEELIEWILQENSLENQHIIDIGTGSGIIPIILKKRCDSATVTAVDISEKALEVAQINSEIHKVAIQFLQLDFLSIEKNAFTEKWNLIVSNPPYIKEEEMQTIPKNVLDFEPKNALFVPNEKPLLFYEKIIEFAKTNLALDGKIYVEINQDLAEETEKLFQKQFHNVVLRKDISGNFRMIRASEPKQVYSTTI